MPTTSLFGFAGTKLEPLKNPEDARVEHVNLAQGTYAKGTLIGEMAGRVSIQTLTTSGTVTSGTFTLTFGANTTAAINFDATATAVAAALNLLASVVTAGGVEATGGPLPGTGVAVRFKLSGARAAITHTDTLTGGSLVITQTQTGTSVTAGRYKAYASGNTDGSENPTHILQYACSVDSSQNISIGDTAGGEWGVTAKSAPAYRCGYFACEDLVGLDATAVTRMNARLEAGTTTTGRIEIPGA
jgi:hypothetical protein